MPKQTTLDAKKPAASEAESIETVTPPDLLELHVGYGLVSLVDTAQGGELLERVRAIRRQTAQDLGFVVPSVHIRDNLQLKPHEYSVLLKGSAGGQGRTCPTASLGH